MLEIWLSFRGNQVNLWLHLEWDKDRYPIDKPFILSPGDSPTVVFRFDNERHVRTLGEPLLIQGGSIEIVSTNVWMGYQVTYDPLMSWLAAVAIMAAILLVTHYAHLALKISRRKA